MKIDYEKLKAGLEGLTGHDFEAAERAEQTSGNNAPMLTLTKGFQARLAATALNIPAPQIKGLPIREYNRVTNEVFGFLYGQSVESGGSENSIEGLQSDAPSTEERNIGLDKRRRS